MIVFRNILICLNALLALIGGGTLLLWPRLVSEWLQGQGERLVAQEANPGAGSLHSILGEVDHLLSFTAASGLIGTLLLACSLLLIWTAARSNSRRGYADHLEYSDDDGGFQVSVKAMEQTLARSLLKLDEVHDMRVVVVSLKDDPDSKVNITAHGGVYENLNLHTVRDRLSSTLKQTFEGMLQPSENVRYDVHLHRIIPRKKGDGEDQESLGPPQEDLDVSFGTKYPLEVEAENEGVV